MSMVLPLLLALNAATPPPLTAPTPTTTPLTPEACQAALIAVHHQRALQHARLKKAPHTKHAPCVKGVGLQTCLTTTFGAGSLVVDVDADFTFITAKRTITGTGFIATLPTDMFRGFAADGDHGPGFTILFDDPVIKDLACSAPMTSPGMLLTGYAKLGSDRVVHDVRNGFLAVDTPIVGGHVVCSDRPQILPLGAFVDVTLQGAGYHPEEDPNKRPVYRSAAPCDGLFVGAGVPLESGAYQAPPPRDFDAPAFRSIRCSGGCRFVLPGKKPLEVQLLGGEGGVVNVTGLGDINRDGAEDFLVSFGDAGENWRTLYLTHKDRFVVVAHSGGWN